jgi:hypothetical protein
MATSGHGIPEVPAPFVDIRRRFLLRCTPQSHFRFAIFDPRSLDHGGKRMKRREFIALLSGAAAALPLTAALTSIRS